MCHYVDEGIYQWEYIDDEGDFDSEWRFKKLIVLDELKSQTNELVSWEKQIRIELSRTSRIRPCMFNEDLQVLYLVVLPGNIFSYSFETKICMCGPRKTIITL